MRGLGWACGVNARHPLPAGRHQLPKRHGFLQLPMPDLMPPTPDLTVTDRREQQYKIGDITKRHDVLEPFGN